MPARVSYLDRLLFTKHLAVMVKAGIPLLEALEMLSGQMNNPRFKKVIREIAGEVKNGQKLSSALSKHPRIFDGLYCALVEVGEQSGSLDKSFSYLATQMQKAYEFKKKVQSAMLYPELVLVVAIVLGGGISLFILPQMINIFSTLTVDLPWTTRALMAFANFMKNYGVIFIVSVLGAISGFGLVVQTKPVKPIWHRFLLGVPILGNFLKSTATATFCRNLGLILEAGLPIDKALVVVANATDNLIFKNYVLQLRNEVEKGRGIGEELENRKKYRFFPVIVAKMTAVGERTGKREESLLYLADFFEEEVDSMTKNFPVVLEPIILVVIAAIVAFTALAIISPIYQFTASVHR